MFMNIKIKFPIKFQVDVSLTESNISGKIFNDDLEFQYISNMEKKKFVFLKNFMMLERTLK